ncbi:2-hydroxyacyl-CoA dehydratase subunit D [Chloroflexota bacterium]
MTTEQKKKSSINRLKSMYPLRALVDGMYENALEYSKEGKPVVWSMVNWWEGDLILRAMDIAAVYPEDYGAVCAAFGAAPKHLERSDADGFPTHMCGYARNGIGYASMMADTGEIPADVPMGGLPKPTFLLCSGSLCDARYKWFQSLGRYLDVPVWTLELPHPGVKESFLPGAYKHNIDFMVAELREFVAFVEKITDRKMDWDLLSALSDNLMEMNRVWYEVNDIRKASPCPMHSRDFWSSMPASLYMAADPRKTASLYQDMLKEVKDRVANGVASVDNEKYRMMFAELPPWHSLGFFNQLADRGWNFVYESWNYHPPRPIDLSGVKDPLEKIARYTFQWLTGFYEDALKDEDWWGYFAHPYVEIAREYKVDGIVLHPLLTCRTATNHLMLIEDLFMKKLKIPAMVMEGDIVDLSLFNPQEALRKAETFEETMEHYRKVRREEGLP